jgi:hypothetical protein
VATTETVAPAGSMMVWLTGWVVIDGGTGAGLTVSVAGLLVAEPAPLVTTTLNVAPLSLTAVGVSV